MPYSFTRMLTIDEPHLIERYNRALKAFDLQPVELERFTIDMTGFSPEVAQALGDKDYLDPRRVNRRFIILTPEQATLSVVHTSFSNTRDLMLEFFERNRRVLYALTIKDVVFGEIEDSIYDVDSIDDLLAIEQVEFKIGTHENLTEKTSELKVMIERLLKEPDAWRDDEMLHEMVSIAKQTGDIRDNELVPEEIVFRHETFWADHFGGTYVFNDDGMITVICDPSAPGFRKSRPWQVGYLDINDKGRVYDFLKESGRLQPPLGSWIERSKLLDFRRHMAAIWLADKRGDELPHSLINQTWVRRWVRENARLVKDNNIIPLIDWAKEEADDWKNIEISNVENEFKFMLCRADPDHRDMALTNRLISHYIPFDFITRFEFNRTQLLQDKEQWSDSYFNFVAMALENTYLNNKQKMFEALYG